MPPRPQLGTAAQTRILDAYAREPGCTDESLGAALADRDASGEGLGSAKLVSAWRQGTRDTMTVAAFDVLLEHVEPAARQPIVDAFLRPYGLRTVAVAAAVDDAGQLERRALRLGGHAGQLLAELAEALEDGVIDPREARRLVSCLRSLVAQANPLLDRLEQIGAGAESKVC